MRIPTLILLFFLATAGALTAQTPANERQAVHEAHLIAAGKDAQTSLLEEKSARLTEAIAIADLESTLIMKAEVAEVMEKVVQTGMVWMQENPTTDGTAATVLDRMKVIVEEVQGLDQPLDTDKVRTAGSLVSEFIALMGRAPF